MDFEGNQAASSSSSHSHTAPSSATNHQTERALRKSTRIKAAREKEREKEKDESAVEQALKRGRDSLKGKGKETTAESPSGRTTKRPRRATIAPPATGLIINEPAKDSKGKKRAAPESVSEDESSRPTSKRFRTSSARSKKDTATSSTMSKKTRTPVKGKSTVKTKTMTMPGPSRHDEDEDMMDVDFGVSMHDEDEDDSDQEDEQHHQDSSDKSDDDQQEEQEKPVPPPPVGAASEARRSLEETMAMFDFGRLGGYMNQLNARLRQLLNNIKPSADATTKLVALQELSELLSISTEDTLAGSFNVENFVRELVRILGGTGGEAARDEGDDDDEDHNDEDAALAAALSLSAGGTLPGDENLEAQLLACRCLANLMEALPGCGHTLVYHGAIPVLCSKLLEISYIDLAEQTLITLEKISEEYPSAIVREGGLAALLNFLDFFSIAVQRTALQAAANCCRNASGDSFPMIKDVWPTIRNCLGYADQRLVDYAALCVIRVIESYHRSHIEKLEALVDADLIRAINALLLPAGGSPLVPTSTFTLLLRGLATAARASPTIAVSLLEANIVTTVYQMLTGVLPPAIDDSEEQGNSASGQGLGGGLADMTVMQNLAHRPKDQVEEALTLVSELLPPLPKDGTFDHKGYSEKALHRMMKAKAKADRAAVRAAAAAAVASLPGGRSPSSSRAQTPTASTPGVDDDAIGPILPSSDISDTLPTLPTVIAPQPKEQAVDRTELLKQHSNVVNRFIRLIFPILVDVYAASVSISVRIKCLASLLKAICFQDADHLRLTLKNVPIASFASSVLSSKDHINLMIGALQMVELLLSKSPEEHKAAFKREGVLHEIETLASRPLPPKVKDKEKDQDKEQSEVVELPDGSNPPSSRRTYTIDPEDAYTLRARVIRFKYLMNDMYSEGDATFNRLQRLVQELKQTTASEDQLREALRELASLFASPHTTVSSFELLQSGLVDALLDFASSARSGVDTRRRQELLIQELAPYKLGKPSLGPSPLGILVKKLQESLTRMESFEVTTVSPGLEDSKRNSPSLLARQIRLRLIAEEGSDTPRLGSGNNIVVSIHAIATFQALNDYLRPRLSGLLSSSRFSSMLAALAAGRASAEALFGGGLTDVPKPPENQATQRAANGSSAQESKPERRRSMRLSAKASSSSLTEKAARESSGPSAAPPSVASTTTVTSASNVAVKDAVRGDGAVDGAGSETAINDEDDDPSAEFMGAELDAEVFEEDMDHDEDGAAEKTVTLSVVEDGSKIVAQTPDGTRVATPNPNSAPEPSASGSNASPPKPSYAAALKNKPSDWQLEFSMDDHVLPLDMTIYGAVHQHESRKTSGAPVQTNIIWQGVYTVKYKKITGPRQAPETRTDVTDPPSGTRSPIPTSLSDEAPHSKILKLLRALHKLNSEIPDSDIPNAQSLTETAFINNKLTAKLTRQLEEPMIVASSCLPDWAMDLPLHFPFLFPFSTRFSFLQSTSFGYARLILKWQSQNRAQESSRRDDAFGFLGRLQRQKVRISRKHILESAFKVFELYGSSSSILEVEYFDEVGTGLGPTLEFYSLVSKEFARRDLKIWRDADSSYPGKYVHHPTGLFPAPVDPEGASTEAGEKRIYIFRIIGQFIAKALLDSRIIDMSFNKIFLKMVLGEDVPLNITTLRHIDPTLANSLSKILLIANPPEGDSSLASIEDLMLDFTLPGYDLELRPGGKDISVTKENVGEYIDAVIDATVGKGVALQAKAFREGFSKVFPVTDLQAFSADELGVLFGNAEEDWSVETLTEAMKADHGFNVESPAIRDLVGIMSDYDGPARRNFLQFITGSPKLPIGGFRGLNPPLTVVRKPHEAPLTADDYLPSVMTCVNYLKLPQYSSKNVMRDKLDVAMKEGVGSFHLS